MTLENINQDINSEENKDKESEDSEDDDLDALVAKQKRIKQQKEKVICATQFMENDQRRTEHHH